MATEERIHTLIIKCGGEEKKQEPHLGQNYHNYIIVNEKNIRDINIRIKKTSVLMYNHKVRIAITHCSSKLKFQILLP